MMARRMLHIVSWLVLVAVLASCGGATATNFKATSAVQPIITGIPINQTPPAASGTELKKDAITAAPQVTAGAGITVVGETNATTSAGTAEASTATGMATEGSASSTAAVTTTGAAVATTSTAAATTTETTPATSASPTADAGATTSAAPGPNGTLTIMSHDNFVLSKDVVTKFEQANGVTLQFLKAGDVGAALNKAILAKNNPLADVFFGVDNTFFSRAIDADIFAPYTPAALQAVPSDFKLDPQNRLIPVDYGFVNLNYDVAAFGAGKLPLPQTLRDLVKPEYKGKLVAESPATSSTGLAFMLATIATFGETGSYTWVDYWKDLHKNDVQIVDGWDTAYNKNFSGSAGKGVQPIVVSYGTSPAYELDASAGKLKEPPTGNMVPPNGAFRQIEFVGVLKGSKHVELARKWVDYMLSADVQNDVMPQMVVYPVVPSATLPDVYKQYAPVPQQPAVIAPDVIAKNRDRWIQQWTDAVGQ